jgi:hypothetical protein
LKSAGIGKDAELKNISNFFLKNWRGLEKAKKMRKKSKLGTFKSVWGVAGIWVEGRLSLVVGRKRVGGW